MSVSAKKGNDREAIWNVTNLPRGTLFSVGLGILAVVVLIVLVVVGVARQAQLLSTIEASAESGRSVVQMQRETLRMIALVSADPENFDANDVQLQRDLIASRFNLIETPLSRSYFPPDILTQIDTFQAQWNDLQPLLDKWQNNPQNTEVQAQLVASLTELEVSMNVTEINFHRARISEIRDIARAGQGWLVGLGATALGVVVLISLMGFTLYRAARQQQESLAAATAARESNRLKSEFLATMSHELRTPLNGVIGYADFLMDAMGKDFSPKQMDYLGRILSNGERLLRLVDDILDVSRIESERLTLISAPFSTVDLMNRVRPDFQRIADEKGLEFTASLDPALPELMVGDMVRLSQIVTNLVTNALKFTDEGRVDLSFKRLNETRWAIEVQDNGPGIAAHAQEYIFDKFRQVDSTQERKKGGAGLGLHIVRSLAVMMGGSIRLQSEAGRGSTFTVELPVIVAEPAGVR
jgi:signal transduction histidine kinase